MAKQGFTVEVADAERTIESVTASRRTVTLRLSSPVAHGQTVEVSYDAPEFGRIVDINGNEMADFADQAATNDVPDPAETDPPTIESAAVSEDGLRVTLTASEDIRFTELPPAPPTGLGELAVTTASIEWRWSAPAAMQAGFGDPDGYEHRHKAGAGAFGGWTATAATDVTLSGLAAATDYTLEVRSTNRAGASVAVSDTARTKDPLPAGPTLVGTVRGSRGAYGLTITSPAGRATYAAQVKFAASPSSGAWIDYRSGYSSQHIATNPLSDRRDLGFQLDIGASIRFRAVDSGGAPITLWGAAVTFAR